jgi:hypothetical protein
LQLQLPLQLQLFLPLLVSSRHPDPELVEWGRIPVFAFCSCLSAIAVAVPNPKTKRFPPQKCHFSQQIYQKPSKNGKNRKKPVETEEIWLTKRSERMKVNCGTVLRTRMNIDDFALQNRMRFYGIFMQVR